MALTTTKASVHRTGRRIIATWFFVIVFLVIPSRSSVLQSAETPLRRRCVDAVVLADGTRLLGSVEQSPDNSTLRILVRAAWLQQNVPQLYDPVVQAPVDPPNGSADLEERLEVHISELQKAANPERERIGFLTECLEDLRHAREKAVEEKAPSAFVLTFPESLVRRRLLQKTPAVRALASAAILSGVDGVEDLSAERAAELLEAVPADKRVTALPAQGGASVDTDTEFRRILVRADRIFGSTLRYIRLGDQLIPDVGGAANVHMLMSQLMQSQMEQQLKELLGDVPGLLPPTGVQAKPARGQLPPQVAAEAERRNAAVVEVTELQLDPASEAATVNLELFRRDDLTDKWLPAAVVSGRATSRDITAAQQQIANDPQVAQVISIFSGLGSGTTQVTQAVSIGAAVQIAQQRAREALERELSRPPGGTVGNNVRFATVEKLPMPAAQQ
ncbi:MAG: hypothetical protein KDA89_03625 [Planctomycetaceae bacterium]|nr:hypothetical protein [Planctomycetaceae bacterium]